MMMVVRRFTLILIGLLMLLWGCGGPRLMMPTPNVYLNGVQDSFNNLPEDLKRTEVKLFYVTDRAPEQDGEGKLRYGYGRSSSLAFGTAVVDLGIGITWEELLQASRVQKRLKPVKLALREVTELVRGPDTPLPYANVDGNIVKEPDLVVKREQAIQTFRRSLVQRLALSPRKEVFIFVHGFHNDFNDAAFALAELWHFLGRIGVPLIYTWPAGYPGLFGYTYDRESSEFTIYHLRETLKFIASFPEVEKIHVIAHSRGTDVAVDALRELTIGLNAAGNDPKRELKIHNFVLAAPDIDVMVAEQRIIGDSLGLSANRFTVYTSPADRAIGIAAKLFRSPRGRIGTFGPENLTECIKADMAFNQTNSAFINYPDTPGSSDDQGDRYDHSYFRDAPSVSSDLVLMLRDDLDPGTPGRPLEHIDLEFWRIPPGYPAVKLAQ